MHEDLTLRNKSIRQIDDRMLSMKQRANKVAADYLWLKIFFIDIKLLLSFT